MPMPIPNEGEQEKDFISRFMGDQAMLTEFPKQEQRAAIAYDRWAHRTAIRNKSKKDYPLPPLKGGNVVQGLNLMDMADQISLDPLPERKETYTNDVDNPKRDWPADLNTEDWDNLRNETSELIGLEPQADATKMPNAMVGVSDLNPANQEVDIPPIPHDDKLDPLAGFPQSQEPEGAKATGQGPAPDKNEAAGGNVQAGGGREQEDVSSEKGFYDKKPGAGKTDPMDGSDIAGPNAEKCDMKCDMGVAAEKTGPQSAIEGATDFVGLGSYHKPGIAPDGQVYQTGPEFAPEKNPTNELLDRAAVIDLDKLAGPSPTSQEPEGAV